MNESRSLKISIAIMIGLVLGIIFGWFMPGHYEFLLPVTQLISSIYMSALQMMIYPLVLCSLIVGIKSIGSISATGKVGIQSLLYYACTTLFAGLLGLFLPRMLGFGKGVSLEMVESSVEPAEFSGLLDTVRNLIPSNPVASFVNGNMLQVLVFAIIVGIACVALKEKADPVVNLAQSINDIAIAIISVVMYCTPVGVFCSIAGVIYANGPSTMIALGAVLLTLYITFLIYGVVVYGCIANFIGKCSPKKFFVTILPAALNAFGTCSSSATLPISKRCCDELGVPNEISAMSLPLGATINMDGVSILMSFMLVFFANACGMDMSFSMLAILLLCNTLLSIGTPGVPNAAIASFAALAAIAGLPAGILGIYVSINTICDMGATCVNVVGDLSCTVAMKQTIHFVPEKKKQAIQN